MFWDFFRKKSFQPRKDVKCKHTSKSNKFKSTTLLRKNEIDCCICGLTQVPLPSNIPLKEALVNRSIGQGALRSAIPFYCKKCGNVICLECIREWDLNGICPEDGTRLQYLIEIDRH